ncbi:MAG: PAS domain S-box containing protein [Solidesulfovibrio magneticus str. Maddingley MBC34]|uniref:histidine kinase n=1 Tax=Solidesulfovibrio magneticus str. Maddingley MBC34 TaxID=1206767 RepID=K6GQZ0_9BACT|nr:MAG: PAS domain S-box containing protein [Solidesulfovibrio magneticus str. Maddingley MBC34]
MRRASLRLKLNAAILLAFLAAAAAFGGVLHLSIQDRLEAARTRTRTLLGVLAAHRLEALAPLLQTAQAVSAAQVILERMVQVDGVIEASLFSAAGVLLADAGASAPAPLASQPGGNLPEARVFSVTAENDRLLATLIEPIQGEGEIAGFLRLRYALKDSALTGGRVWTIFGLAVAGAYVFLALVLNAMLHLFVLRPVNTLRQALEAVEAGDLDQTVPVAGADALGRLGAAFNAMSARLRETSRWLGESRAEVEEHRLLLARRVEERTAELARTNARLTTEIEARCRAEDSLSRHLALYRATLESTAEAVLCVSANPEREVLVCNRRFLDLWGLPEDWAQRPEAADRFQPFLEKLAEPDAVVSNFRTLMLDSTSMAETCHATRDGRYIERRSGPILQDGVYIGRVFSYVDVTDRRRTEAELRQTLAQRDALLGNTRIGLATTENAVCTDINTQGAALLGYDREAMLGQSIAVLFPDAAVYQSLADLSDHDFVSQGYTRRECQVQRGDGEMIWLRAHGKSVRPEDPTTSVVWAFDDITEEKRRQQSLEQARDQAEEASRAKGAFLAVMSHEIRTPLNAVIGLSDALLEGQAAPEQIDHLRAIRESAGHLLGVVNDILDFSKIEAGKLVLERRHFDPRALVAEAVRAVELAASQKGLALRATVAPDVPAALRGDPGRLRQILLNLLGNAVKFTAAGSVSLTVETVPAEQTPPGRVGLAAAVADTGIGLDPTRASELFERFNQGPGNAARRFGGTGLGLAISKELVERLGGHIGVTSRQGAGSRFAFTVFLQPGDPAAVPPAPQPAVRDKAALGPLRILLVEDNALNAAVTRLHMGRMGHDLTVAESAREAFACLAKDRFDAVLMDIEMPEIDGIEATSAIRAGAPLGTPILDPTVPIIAVTAHAVEDVRQQCLEAGMDGFVTKPVNYRALEATLDALRRETPRLPARMPSPPTCPPPETELFAPGQAKENMGLTWSQFQGLLRTSFDEANRRLGEIRQTMAAGQWDKAALAVHTFKATAATVGAFAARNAAKALEKALRAERRQDADALLADLEQLWKKTRQALDDWRCPPE